MGEGERKGGGGGGNIHSEEGEGIYMYVHCIRGVDVYLGPYITIIETIHLIILTRLVEPKPLDGGRERGRGRESERE